MVLKSLDGSMTDIQSSSDQSGVAFGLFKVILSVIEIAEAVVEGLIALAVVAAAVKEKLYYERQQCSRLMLQLIVPLVKLLGIGQMEIFH